MTARIDERAPGTAAARARLQTALTTAFDSASRPSTDAGGGREAGGQAGGQGGGEQRWLPDHGVHLLLPVGGDSLDVLSRLLREVGAALDDANRACGARSGIRLRLALARGLVLPPGIAGHAVAECLRLLDSDAVRATTANLTVVASDSFFQNVVARGLLDHRPEDYRPVRVGRGASPIAWLHAPDGPAPDRPVADGPCRSRAGEMAARAGRLLGRGEYRQAILDLEETLRLLPGADGPDAEESLLRLGDCHRRLGDVEAAAQTWSFLLARRPLCAAVCQRLGRLELERHRTHLALVYLTEGLRLIRSRPLPALPAVPAGTAGTAGAAGAAQTAAQTAVPTGTPGTAADRLACALLLDLSCVRTALGDLAVADAFLNEAAEADPRSPLPLVPLAFRAARRRDLQTTRRLLGTALIRVSGEDRKDFLREVCTGAASREGGDVIIRVLQEHGLYPAASPWTTNVPRPPPA
ncbi:tol-pal system YbgF family protein [Nonomuraea sp. NPDC049646]|uniref:tetratricopeptide repeat protein n=1 Tax=unclassified Nonomuraea TaxID=2593643 RepID=UPI0037A23BB6